KLALYDPPFQVAGKPEDYWANLARRIDDLVRTGDRGDAVALFQTEGVGIPADVVAQLRGAPFWPALESIAHTLVYESLILASQPDLVGVVVTETLVIVGGVGPEP